MIAVDNANNLSPDSGEFPSDRRKVIRADLELRLRKVCSNFSDEEFHRLIELMTDRKLRSERRNIS
ncbi:MAG TPA: hypothetical protein VM099_05220 [Gemmatimonadaceae bacterium]|nr:hypothetical protein [Gemmatimonadaceae bacterium]